MIAKNVTEKEMNEALRLTNVDYQNNVQFKTFEPKGKGFTFTLRVASSKGLGAKRGFSGKRTVACCYHAHYAFMDNLFKLNPTAKLTSTMETYNGQSEFLRKASDVAYKNIGSVMRPMEFGSCCDC